MFELRARQSLPVPSSPRLGTITLQKEATVEFDQFTSLLSALGDLGGLLSGMGDVMSGSASLAGVSSAGKN
ncbi:hypothetical protein [Speluncibacter jeojiensis]|uniref:Uncharacterized protein n=1 Tax=Speluncibacter jeojiensis TaxID=2710754 RepID=A0A9X4LW18_9ACTN|nr:hypothetical protein [Corynebacteriales bacterium D3-21]